MRKLARLAAAGAAATLAAMAAPASAGSCNEACLLSLADKFTVAIAEQDFRRLPWADPTYFAENNVSLMIGDSWWGSVGKTPGIKVFAVADKASGNVVWFGTIWDHDEPSFGAVRIQAPDGKIEAIEVIAGRKPLPIPFGDPRAFGVSADFGKAVKPADRRSRERLIDIADAYLATKQRNNGTLVADFGPDCTMAENGVQITSAEAELVPEKSDCASVFSAGLFAPVERIRDRRFPVVDPARGLVVAISVQDIPTRETSFRTTDGTETALKRQYPLSRLVAELIRIEGDKVMRAEGVVTSLPYRMPTPWKTGRKP